LELERIKTGTIYSISRRRYLFIPVGLSGRKSYRFQRTFGFSFVFLLFSITYHSLKDITKWGIWKWNAQQLPRVLRLTHWSVVTNPQQVDSRVESSIGRVKSRVISLSGRAESMASLELSQWLHELYGDQKCPKKFPTSGKMSVSASRITFYFFKPFQDCSQPIQLQYFWWIYREQVVPELTQVIYGRNQQVESQSFGAVDSSRVIFRIVKLRLESTRVRVNDSTRYNTDTL
jgi:hypothetical protein